MKRAIKNQRGIALMIVLAAITLLTSVATEFAYNTNITYNLALNEKERTQAYLLAESAIQLMKLELKLEKELRAKVGSSAAAQGLSASLSAPLCQQFPLSTSLIRSMFLGETGEGAVEGEGEEGREKKGAEEGLAEQAAFVGGLQVEAAEEFLDFEGDFEGQCFDESAKFNLNVFFGKDPAKEVMSGYNEYDKAKQLLYNILKRPQYKKLFRNDDSDKEVKDIARNIADWVDANDRIDEGSGTTAGNESSLYTAGITEYPVKNSKFLTIEEVAKVSGVNDSWWLSVRENFTIYGEDKVNVCLADDELIEALIVQYAGSNEDIPPLNPEDKEKMSKLVDIVKGGCTGVKPDVSAISTALNQALGITQTTDETNFSSFITTDSRYYTLIGTGYVGDTEVKITTVLDTKAASAEQWKYVYWRVE